MERRAFCVRPKTRMAESSHTATYSVAVYRDREEYGDVPLQVHIAATPLPSAILPLSQGGSGLCLTLVS